MDKPKVAFNNSGCIGLDNDIRNIAENLSTATNNFIIDSLLKIGLSDIYQFNSSSVRLDESGEPIADVVKLKLLEKTNLGKNNSEVIPLVYGDVACSYSEIVTMNMNEFDIIFIRGDDIKSNPDIVEICNKAQKPLYVNSPEGTIIANDKFKIKARAEKNDIKIPQTYYAKDFKMFSNTLKKIPTKYKVVKARYGFGGQQVWRVTSETAEEELWKIFEKCDGGAVVQEYKSINERGDLRLCVFDGQILGKGAILREAGPKKWQNNIDLGGSQKPFTLDERIKKVVKKVSEAYPEVRLQGIDLFLDGTFIETNAYPSSVGYIQWHFGVKAQDIILNKILDEISN